MFNKHTKTRKHAHTQTEKNTDIYGGMERLTEWLWTNRKKKFNERFSVKLRETDDDKPRIVCELIDKKHGTSIKGDGKTAAEAEDAAAFAMLMSLKAAQTAAIDQASRSMRKSLLLSRASQSSVPFRHSELKTRPTRPPGPRAEQPPSGMQTVWSSREPPIPTDSSDGSAMALPNQPWLFDALHRLHLRNMLRLERVEWAQVLQRLEVVGYKKADCTRFVDGRRKVYTEYCLSVFDKMDGKVMSITRGSSEEVVDGLTHIIFSIIAKIAKNGAAAPHSAFLGTFSDDFPTFHDDFSSFPDVVSSIFPNNDPTDALP